jgi:hypothetical protein
MVIPLADGLNHANVDSKNHVLHKSLHLSDLNYNGFDFSDFGGEIGNTEGDMRIRTYGSGLENFLVGNELPETSYVWELEAFTEGYISSSDEEDSGSVVDESETPNFDWYEWDDTENAYFVMSNNTRASYEEGQEVTISYGNRSNSFLLLHYGFAMDFNPYDAFVFRCLKAELEKRKEEIDVSEYTHLNEFSSLFKMKYLRVNTKFMEHLREVVWVETEGIETPTRWDKPVSLENESFAAQQGLKILT